MELIESLLKNIEVGGCGIVFLPKENVLQILLEVGKEDMKILTDPLEPTPKDSMYCSVIKDGKTIHFNDIEILNKFCSNRIKLIN